MAKYEKICYLGPDKNIEWSWNFATSIWYCGNVMFYKDLGENYRMATTNFYDRNSPKLFVIFFIIRF